MKKHLRRTTITLLTAAAGAALVLPACGAEGPSAPISGGGGSSGSPTEIVDEAIADTLVADQLTADMTARVSGFAMDQVVDVKTVLDRPGERATFVGQVQGETVEMVAIGDTTYVTSTVPAFTDALGGATWMKDPEGPEADSWTDADMNPMADLLYKLTGHGTVEEAGTSELAGEPLTSYRFTVDEGVPAGVPEEYQDGVAKLVHSDNGEMRLVAEVGIDEAGYVRSVDLDATVTSEGEASDIGEVLDESSTSIDLAWDVEVTSVDEPVDIEEPAEWDTIDAADVPDSDELVDGILTA